MSNSYGAVPASIDPRDALHAEHVMERSARGGRYQAWPEEALMMAVVAVGMWLGLALVAAALV